MLFTLQRAENRLVLSFSISDSLFCMRFPHGVPGLRTRSSFPVYLHENVLSRRGCHPLLIHPSQPKASWHSSMSPHPALLAMETSQNSSTGIACPIPGPQSLKPERGTPHLMVFLCLYRSVPVVWTVL